MGATGLLTYPTDPPAQGDTSYRFLVFPTSSTIAGTPILPRQLVYIKSVHTGEFCRVTAVRNFVCDVGLPSLATPVMMDPAGLAVNGQPLVNPGSGQDVTIGGNGTPGTITPGETDAAGSVPWQLLLHVICVCICTCWINHDNRVGKARHATQTRR